MRPRAAFHAKQAWFSLKGEEIIRVRFFDSRGTYPKGKITLPSGFFYADESLAVLVTKGHSWHYYIEDCGFDEFESPFPAEASFMGSMILCENMDGPSVRFYLLNTPVFLLDPLTVDITSSGSQEEVIALIRDHSNWPNRNYVNRFERLPPGEFQLIEQDALDLEQLQGTWENIRPNDFILLRGLVSLFKSDMLSNHREFGAEALMSLYVALECSFQLVLQQLKSRGNLNPTASDAARWLHDTFDQHWNFEEPDPAYKYFQEFYEGRVMMFHPRSRFGDLPYAPNFWGDVIHLRRSLPNIFFYLVNGEHSKSFIESVAEFCSKQSAI